MLAGPGPQRDARVAGRPAQSSKLASYGDDLTRPGQKSAVFAKLKRCNGLLNDPGADLANLRALT